MKKVLSILILLGVSILSLAQVGDTDSFFKEYSGAVGYKTVYLGQKMLEMSSGAGNPVVKDIDMIRILTSETDDSVMIGKIRAIADGRYELISATDNSGDVTSFYLSEKRRGKKSFLMIAIRDGRDIVMEIIGDYKVEDISRLSQLAGK